MKAFESTTVVLPDGTGSNPMLEPKLPAAFVKPHWYAAYTRAHHEKRVAEQLQLRSVEIFLPLYEDVHRWKDRRQRVHLPLFPGYVFVCIPLKERLSVLELPSVVRLVGFNGHPTPLPDGEVEALREGLAKRLHAEPCPFVTLGRRVRMRSGPLAGLEGILVRRKGNCRIVLSMDLIQRSIIVDVDAADLEPVPNGAPLIPASAEDPRKVPAQDV